MSDKKNPIDEKPIQSLPPRFNDDWEPNQRNSDSDYIEMDKSSSSEEVENPDSQKHIQKNPTFNCMSNNLHSFHRKSSSPLENPDSQNFNPGEIANLILYPKEVSHINKTEESLVRPVKFDANLSIDPKEVSPIKQTKESNVSPASSPFSITLKENMFKAMESKDPLVPRNLDVFSGVCRMLKLSPRKKPKFLKDYEEHENHAFKLNSDSHHCAKVLNGKIDKKIDSRHFPSTSLQGSMESSKSCPESKHDRKRKQKENTETVLKVKKLKQEQQPSLAGKPKHKESVMPFAKLKELKEKQQPSLTSKLIHKEDTLPVPIVLKRELQFAQNSKQKLMARTQSVVRGKELKTELKSVEGRTLKCKGSKKVEQQSLNLDTKRVCAMAPEARNCDKNNIKKRASPDQSAMIAITSSKKERTAVYHGGRKCEIPKLKDLCIRVILKGIKQTSDPTKYINKNVSFDALEPILVKLPPEKLRKVEEVKKYLLASTDHIWKSNCERRFKSLVHLRRENEPWRAFHERCCLESNEKLKSLTASINASASKVKPDRQIKFTTVEPTKRQKTDYAVAAKCNGNSSAVKPLPKSTHPSNSRSVIPVPPKSISNHIKPAHRTTKKDAPLMHKAKKTWDQLNRIHRN